MRIKNCDKPIKGDPILEMANTDGIEGHLIRMHVLKAPSPNEKKIVEKAVGTIMNSQLPNGSWNGSIIETCANIDRLLAYGVSPKEPSLRKSHKWLYSQQLNDHPVWTGMFAESGKPTNSMKDARGGYNKRELYAKHYRHLTSEPCCASTPVVATCCALEVLFALGDDVSSNPSLALPVNRILAHGNATDGICGGQSSKFNADTAPEKEKRKLWNSSDNRIFRRDCEVNPGTTICAHILIRAVARSKILSKSKFIKTALEEWKEHQLSNGNFNTKYNLYDFYYAIDTLVLLRQHDLAREMFLQMLPAILRRQKKDGKWWKKGEWVDSTFSVLWALHSFGLLKL